MKVRRIIVCLGLTAMAVGVAAQVSLVSDGDVVAHGVTAVGDMPPALRECLRGRVAHEARVAFGTCWDSEAYDARGARRVRKADVPLPVAPLLHSIRDQHEPYNWLCPQWTSASGHTYEQHCVSGCVATCIEQVMAYYRYPEALLDTLHGWETDNYVVHDMLPGTRFDWDNYLDDYRKGYTQAQGEAIALTTLAAGMAVNMHYGLESSGANLWTAEKPLREAFGYGTVRLYDRALYSPRRWHAILQHELREGRPVAYAAHTMGVGGHAFNIDGVDASGYYHVNWGYNGCYDGWYDLDWLHPWEPADTLGNGFVSGFFCNHMMLTMHPQANVPQLEPDTFRLDSLGVRLNAIRFLRQPDTQGFVPADFDFENASLDTVTYTYEVMTYLPTDTAVFYQADYVGLSGLTLLPGERRTQRVYLQFDETGDRILGISHDDETIPFTMPVTIDKGTPPALEWGSATVSIETVRGPGRTLYDATFCIPVSNTAASGTAGDLVTFCLYADGHADEDTRHYEVLSLPAGESRTLKVRFRNLSSVTHYTFLVRCPWTVVAEADFTTAVEEVKENGERKMNDGVYDLSGRRAAGRCGIVITNGRKYLYDPRTAH